MTRIIFVASLLAFSSAAAVNQASAQTRQQCESTATNCLGGCASIRSDTSWYDVQRGKTMPGPGPGSKYADCMSRCDRERTECLGRARR
jgi:hypothetical protein